MEKIDILRNAIVDRAEFYKGEKEISGNKGFVNSHFEKKMKERGWNQGQAWCSYAAEQFWYEGYSIANPKVALNVSKLFSANAVRTYNNLVANGFEGSNIPEPGDLVIWQSYRQGKARKSGEWFLGHIGTVIDVDDKGFTSIEGNSNQAGGREGIEVAEKKRKYTWKSNNGLRLIGFIKPKYLKG